LQENRIQKKTTAKGAEGNYVPGFGIKFLRDGVPSANLVAMYGVDGQASWNYFKHDFSNHIPAANALDLKFVAAKFKSVQTEVGIIGLRPLAEYTEKGVSRIDNPVFPFKLVFRPTEEARGLFPDIYNGDYLEELKKNT